MTNNNIFSVAVIFALGLLSISSCMSHPGRVLIIDLEKGEAKVSSSNLVIVEFNLDRIGPIRYREYNCHLEKATSNIHFEPISRDQFYDSSFAYPDLTLTAWAIDTLRNQEYYFYESYLTWEQIRRDTTDNFYGVSAPKYINIP